MCKAFIQKIIKPLLNSIKKSLKMMRYTMFMDGKLNKKKISASADCSTYYQYITVSIKILIQLLV